MENYQISIHLDKEIHHFEVGEYLHQNEESCKIKVFQQGKLVASFEPDPYHFLQLCQNPAKLSEKLLHLLADEIEARHPHEVSRDLNEDM